ncbi:MAG: hypothetical protein ACNA8L_03380 [Luteolibacter sp.]|jgi:hypothetical protein
MHSDNLSHFESKLRRSLMPVALSGSATESIHTLLDELAGVENPPAEIPASKPVTPRKTAPWNAAAAAVAGLLAVAAWLVSPQVEDLAFTLSSDDHATLALDPQNMHLVDESTRLAWVEDEGWLDDPDGIALRAVRMRVVEENRLLDAQTGLIVHVSSPREEMLLMPVSTF